MPWVLKATFTQRPHMGNVIGLDHVTSISCEFVPDGGAAVPPPPTSPRNPRTHDPYDDRHAVVQPMRPRGHVHRNQTPTGSFPTFEVPKSDGTLAQAVIDDADIEGYAAYLEADSAVSPAEVMSPYPAGSLLDKAWKNGYARAEHSDARDDD